MIDKCDEGEKERTKRRDGEGGLHRLDESKVGGKKPPNPPLIPLLPH